jgi:hypothetical protein
VQNEKDPWLERTEGGVGKHEFEMLSV